MKTKRKKKWICIILAEKQVNKNGANESLCPAHEEWFSGLSPKSKLHGKHSKWWEHLYTLSGLRSEHLKESNDQKVEQIPMGWAN